ncbi:hypothetical protein FRB99_005290 [Tulasnella sp. 403]|nr:hypothetical protein FRB99_005290 [Tulasnella sp. 403]
MMQSKRRRATVQQPLPQAFGALSLDSGLQQSTHLAPPDDPAFSTFGGGFSSSSSAASSLVGTPQRRSDSPDLGLLGAPLPPPTAAPLPEPVEDGGSPYMQSSLVTTLAQKTMNGNVEMPGWMEEVTKEFAKEAGAIMHEVGELRKEKHRLQCEIAQLMTTLSQYSPGGQFAPAWPTPASEPVTPAPEPTPEEPRSPGPKGPVKPGWKVVRPEPKKIRSKVVGGAPTKVVPALPAPPPPPPKVIEPPKPLAWQTWKPKTRGLPPPAKAAAPPPPPPVIMPTLFGE